MSKETQQLLDQILSLPDEERAALIVGAMESFAHSPELAKAQEDEAFARLAAYRSGLIQTHSEEEALALIANDS